jgi:hypothetical protein
VRRLAPLISAVALALVFVPALLYLGDSIDKPRMQTLMLIGTALWFASAPFWIGARRDE